MPDKPGEKPPAAAEVRVVPFKKGDYDADVAHFTKEIARNPASGHESRGYSHYLNDDYDLAIADYSEAIRLAPDQARVYARRAAAHEDKESPDDLRLAIADYGQVIRLTPADPIAWYDRARVRRRIGELAGAIADLSQAIGLDPRQTFYHDRGAAYLKSADLDAAMADLDQAIRLDPDKSSVYSRTAHALYDRGLTFAAKGDFDRAIADYDRAIELGITKSAHLYRDRGNAWKAKGDHARAVADFDRALNLLWLNKDRVATLCARGDCHLVLAAFDRAAADFTEALRLDGENEAAKAGLRAAMDRNGLV